MKKIVGIILAVTISLSQFVSIVSVKAETDITPPSVIITAPTNNSLIGNTITIYGTVSDENIASWTLQYAKGTSPNPRDFFTFKTNGATNVINGELGTLNTSSLTEGLVYTLRLRAVDSAGNISISIVLVTKDTTLPSAIIFYPQSSVQCSDQVNISAWDTNLESWILEYGIGISPSYYAQIDSGTQSGGFLCIWDNISSLPESIYTLRLTVKDKAGNISQLSTLPIKDHTNPITNILSPIANSNINISPIVLRGTAMDDAIRHWRYEYGYGLVPETWTTIYRDDTSYIEASNPLTDEREILWDTSTLIDGEYSLRLSALDKGGNSSQTIIPLILDTQIPVADITIPSNNAYRSGIIAIEGIASDNNLSTWTLEYGSGSSPSTWTEIESGTSSVTDSTLGAFDTSSLTDGDYTLRLKVTDKLQNIVYSNIQIFVDNTPPSTPIGLTCFSRTDETATLAWTASTDNIGVTVYNIYRDGTKVGSTSDTTYTDSELSLGNTYVYTVIAKDEAGNFSDVSISTGVTMADTTSPSEPTNLVCISYTDTASTLAWTESTDNAEVIGYDIYRNGSIIGNTDHTTYTDRGLVLGNTYEYMVVAKDAAGNVSPASTILNVTILDTTPPTAPSDFICTSHTDTIASLTWSASIDNGNIIGYDIYRDGTKIGSVAGTSYMDSSLTLGQTYSYTVKAKDAAGNVSAASAVLTVIADATPPTAPTNLTCTSSSDTSATISWTAATDNVAVASYDIYRDGTMVGNTTDTTYTDNGLTPSTTYSYIVKAKDAAGNVSDASNVLSVTIKDTNPPTLGWIMPSNGLPYKNLMFNLSASNIFDPSGVSSVLFSVYNQKDGPQNYIAYPGINMGGGTWEVKFDATRHITTTGTFIVNIRGCDYSGNSGIMGTTQFSVVNANPATVEQFNIEMDGNEVTVIANKVRDPLGISFVKINVHGFNSQTGQAVSKEVSLDQQVDGNWSTTFSPSILLDFASDYINIDLTVEDSSGKQSYLGYFKINL